MPIIHALEHSVGIGPSQWTCAIGSCQDGSGALTLCILPGGGSWLWFVMWLLRTEGRMNEAPTLFLKLFMPW